MIRTQRTELWNYCLGKGKCPGKIKEFHTEWYGETTMRLERIIFEKLEVNIDIKNKVHLKNVDESIDPVDKKWFEENTQTWWEFVKTEYDRLKYTPYMKNRKAIITLLCAIKKRKFVKPPKEVLIMIYDRVKRDSGYG